MVRKACLSSFRVRASSARHNKLPKIAVTISLVALLAGTAAAAPLPITLVNPSFEDPALAPGAITLSQNAGSTPGWTVSAPANNAGLLHMTTTGGGFVDAQPAYHGSNVMWLHTNCNATQSLANRVLVGEYTLSARVSHRRSADGSSNLGPNSYDLELLVNGSPVAASSKTLPVTDGTAWQLASATYTFAGDDPLLSGVLAVRLSSGGVQQLFDAVSLTYTPPVESNWTYEGTASITTTPSWMRDAARIRVQDMAVDLEGNVFMTTSTGDDLTISGGVTIFRPNGSGGWNVVTVDVSQNGLNIPGGITKLLMAGDGKIYGLQAWNEINWGYARGGWTNKILRISPTGSVEVVYDAVHHPQYGSIALFGAPTGGDWGDQIRGMTVGRDGNIYWTMIGIHPWRNRFFWRYNILTDQVEEAPINGANNGWGQNLRITAKLHSVEGGEFVVINGATGADITTDYMTWTENRIWGGDTALIANGRLVPGWGMGHLVTAVYDPIYNKLWTGPRGNNGSVIMGRFNGRADSDKLFGWDPLEAKRALAPGTCIGTQDIWHANGNGVGGNSNGGNYWVAALKVNPADGSVWASWGAVPDYNFGGAFGPIGFVYTMGPTDCSLTGNAGNPQFALNGNASQTVSLAFKGAKVYAQTVDLITGQFHLFSAPVTPAPTGACCVRGNACIDATETECIMSLGGVYQGDGTNCATTTCNVVGACCQKGNVCSMEMDYDCEALGGALQAGQSCEQVDCRWKVCQDIIPDTDGDGDVDQLDFAIWQSCITIDGAISDDPVKCSCYDVAGGPNGGPDGRIDSADFGPFVNCGSGASVPLDPGCVN